ncbi:MAG: hypothetical protein IKM59_00595 [Oscillospiraceae bacterium]|nr:hypothetical protein [Oscillospiraceae bacterium]
MREKVKENRDFPQNKKNIEVKPFLIWKFNGFYGMIFSTLWAFLGWCATEKSR